MARAGADVCPHAGPMRALQACHRPPATIRRRRPAPLSGRRKDRTPLNG
jgi:hypothetical protein